MSTRTLDVYEHGDESLVKFQLKGPRFSIGAWADRSWSFNSDLFYSSFKMYADGIEVQNIEIIAESTPQSDNPNSADLWPHISNDDYGTVGNFIEIWIKHDFIEHGAAVTWSCDENVLTQSLLGSEEVFFQSADSQASTYKSDFLDYIDGDSEGIFLSTSGTMPKLPYLEKDLTPDHTYANDGDITSSDIDGTLNGLFCIDITIGSGATGTIFEIGDSSNGLSAIIDGTDLIVKAGDSTDSITVTRSISNTGHWPLEQRFIFGVYVDVVSGELSVYTEGTVIRTESGTIGDYSNASLGHVGGVSGDFISIDDPSQAPNQSGLTIHSSLRYYEDPTLSIGIDETNSKDWFPHGYNTLIRDIYEGQPWESEVTKYEYSASAIADIRNPGSINELASIQAARELSSWQTGGSGMGEKAVFWAFKSGDTWTNNILHKSSSHANSNGNILDCNCTGKSVELGIVYTRYGGTDLVTFDWSAHPTGTDGMPGFLNTRKVSYLFVEDRVFKFIGNGETDSSYSGGGISITCNGSNIEMHTYRIGGIWFKDIPDTAISYISNGDIEATSNISGHTWGEMCFDNVGTNWFRNACFSTGEDEYGNLQRVQIGKSYYDIGWAGATQDQAHGAYSKGYVPYLRIKGGWTPPGPGAAWKMDAAGLTVIEDFVSIFHTPLGFHNNGGLSSIGEPWEEVTDRSKGAGRHGKHVCFQDFVAGDIQVWAMDMIGAVNCEARRGIMLGPDDSQMGFWRDNTTSTNASTTGGGDDRWCNYTGDNWNSGYQEMTLIGSSGIQVRLPWSDDRANSTHAAGSHYCYMNKVLSVAETDAVVRFESWNDPYDQTFIEAAAAGRITDFRISKTHLSGSFEENGIDLGSFATAQTTFDDSGESIFKDTTIEGSVVFENANPSQDIMLQYLIDNGYSDYDEFETAIVDSWESGWDSVPSALKTENMRKGIAFMVSPTNLDESDYGGMLPGFPFIPPELESATIENDNPNQVILVFSKSVYGTEAGFSLSGTTSVVFDDLSVDGSETERLIATLSDNAVFGEIITLDYDAGSIGDIEDDFGNPVGDISEFSVTNNVEQIDVTAPTLQSATVEDNNPNQIVLVFDENVLFSNTGWTVSGTTSTAFDSISGSGTDTIIATLSDNVIYTEVITLDYAEISGGVTDLSLNDLVDISSFPVTNNTVEKVLPTLDNAYVYDASPDRIVMRFSEEVTGTNAGFAISGTTSTVFDSISGFGTDSLTGILSDDVLSSDNITIDYVGGSIGDIEDLSGNILSDISSKSVFNLVSESNPPVIQSATVENSNPSRVILVFDENVAGAINGFELFGTTSTSFIGVSGSGSNTLSLSISDPVVYGENLSLSYRNIGGGIADSFGNFLETIMGLSITNNVLNTDAPILESATIENSNPNQMVLVFSEDIIISEIGFSISGMSSNEFTSVEIDGSNTNIALANFEKPVESLNTVFLSYSAGSFGDTTDLLGNPLEDFSDFAVTNNVSETQAPTLQSGSITNSNPDEIILFFDEPVNMTNAGFTLSGTTSTAFDSISGSGTDTIIATLSDAAVFGENIFLSYNNSVGDIADLVGNPHKGFSNFTIDNNIGELVAPTLQSATIEDDNPDQIVLVFDENVVGSSLGFTLSGTTSTIINEFIDTGEDTDTLIGILSNDVVQGETVLLSYSSGSITDEFSNPLANITNFSVTNNALDDDDPILVSTYPENNAIDIPLTPSLILNFDEDIQAGAGRIVLKNYETESVIEEILINDSGQVTIANNKITVIPALSLSIGTRYYITVDNGAIEDAYDNVWNGISDKNTWNFTSYVEAIPFPFAIESEIYSSLSTSYAKAAKQINFMVDSLYDALSIVASLDDSDTKVDLIKVFHNAWQDQRSAPTQNLSSSARFLNQYILGRTSYDDINDFLNEAEIQVSPEWADLSGTVGFPIDPVYVSS